mmetsp:Transcript_41688/g.109958  ORF Transcript_41688/g.109958 Transcript_41688/m.109958 type:complete len:252 (-) Transcript_41688:207-962(-)|eukprot:CAMPEP_0115866246 /NCGR_PEP_ID=MMETSP0287-20121206/20149_1 /TAXON_ID=412157 /ORGANISM="Chrysochromulina rotalis, Strain UIO044" /LENGTH=251 /DNA_ID=CAMNT_0003320805 /DNA_START=70 /DNA_END=825 /DNA_ORIENTATION=+
MADQTSSGATPPQDLRSPLDAAASTEAAAADTTSFAYKLSIGHQEIDRIVDEVEQIYKTQPTEWLSVEPIGNMVVMLLDWYEDFDELEDACGGSFEEFLRSLPQFEVKSEDGKSQFKVLMPDPDAPPTIMTLNVEKSSDLWRVLFKSPDASLKIPHLEFEVGADSKRRIDTVYNHITSAIWNLSSHVRNAQGATPGLEGGAELSADASAILQTVEALEACLDVVEPFVIIVDDPTGASKFKPDDDVEIDEM